MELTEQLSEMPRQLQYMTKQRGLSKYAATAFGVLSRYALFVSGVDFFRDIFESPSAEVLEAEIHSLGVHQAYNLIMRPNPYANSLIRRFNRFVPGLMALTMDSDLSK